MFRSMRARLTLWYTGVLALVLILFSLVTYAYLVRAAAPDGPIPGRNGELIHRDGEHRSQR